MADSIAAQLRRDVQHYHTVYPGSASEIAITSVMAQVTCLREHISLAQVVMQEDKGSAALKRKRVSDQAYINININTKY